MTRIYNQKKHEQDIANHPMHLPSGYWDERKFDFLHAQHDAWAIREPSGRILPATVSRVSYNACVHNYVEGDVAFWDRIYEHGWRCVKFDFLNPDVEVNDEVDN